MKCECCGATIPKNALFCPECGSSISNLDDGQNELGIMEMMSGKRKIFWKEEKEDAVTYYIKKKAVFAAAAAIVGIAGISCAAGGIMSVMNRVDLTKYINVSVSGYNGSGDYYWDINKEALMKELYGTTNESALKDSQRREYYNVLNYISNNTSVSQSAETDGLTNGDKLEFSIYEPQKLELSKKTVKENNKYVYEVKGLVNPVIREITDYLDFYAVGSEGSGYLRYSVKEELPVDSKLNISCSGQYITVNDSSFYLEVSENVGSLSNGDTVEIYLTEYSYEANDSLLNEYGECLNLETVEMTVENLEKAQTLDVFSMIDLDIAGVENEGYIKLAWKEMENLLDYAEIYAEDYNSWYFELYAPRLNNTNTVDYVENKEDAFVKSLQYVGEYCFYAEPSEGIGIGDEVTIRVSNHYQESLEKDVFSSYGIELASTDKIIQADNTMLGRYLTEESRLTQDNAKKLSETMIPELSNYLMNNWGNIVHGNSSYICYDQEITAEPVAGGAFMLCTDESRNEYTIWLPYVCSVIDSSLEEEKDVYLLAEIRRPIIYADDSIVISEPAYYDYYNQLEDMVNTWWYQNENLSTVMFE